MAVLACLSRTIPTVYNGIRTKYVRRRFPFLLSTAIFKLVSDFRFVDCGGDSNQLLSSRTCSGLWGLSEARRISRGFTSSAFGRKNVARFNICEPVDQRGRFSPRFLFSLAARFFLCV